MSEEIDDDLYQQCLIRAEYLIANNFMTGDLFQSADIIYNAIQEKRDKDAISDSKIDYNDEIISIESVGLQECVDISVTGDNLFYCNGILTKNSIGLPATVDFMFAIIRSEELDNLGQVLVKQLKSRYNDVNYHRKFVVGIDISKFKFYNVDNSYQKDISERGRTDDVPLFDKSKTGVGKRDFARIDFN